MMLFCVILSFAHLLFWFGGLRLAYLLRSGAVHRDRSFAQTICSSCHLVAGSPNGSPDHSRSNAHTGAFPIRAPLTFFRPVKPGVSNLRSRLEHFLEQLRPGDEVLFGVLADQIQEGAICRSLSKPKVRLAVVECEPNQFANPKVNKLAQMQTHADYWRWILLDSDAAPTARFLAEVLRHPSQTTAITAMYRFIEISSWPELADAAATLHFLWIGTLWRRCLGNQDYMFGACIVVARSLIEQIGGFPRLGDYLADDYHLGRLLHQTGFKIELAAELVDVAMDRLNWAGFFFHQLRAACTYRTSTPAGYFGSVLAQAVPAVIAGMLVSWQTGLSVLFASVLLRAFVHFLIEQAFGGKASFRRILLVTPILLATESIVWSASWFLPRIRWGNRKIALHRDGRIRR